MRIGSLFTGYGGLDLAVEAFFDADLAWYAEIEKAACTVLESHYDAPNLGDICDIDWATVPSVDILTGGYPCQPFSHAGSRKGKKDERHLWPHVKQALETIRPMVGIFENVDGHRSLGFSDVLADLAEIGYDAEWITVRAADAGAPHHRKRLFILTYPSSERHGGGEVAREMAGLGSGAEGEAQQWERAWQKLGARGIEGAAHSDSAAGTQRYVGTETRQQASFGLDTERRDLCGVDWQEYEPAIRRWEQLTRPAPEPTEPGKTGAPRLSPSFVEWMMGLPEGWVTGHGLARSAELKMLGNGVVPQQAMLALNLLLEGTREET